MGRRLPCVRTTLSAVRDGGTGDTRVGLPASAQPTISAFARRSTLMLSFSVFSVFSVVARSANS